MLNKISSIRKLPNYQKERVYLINKISDDNAFFLFNDLLTFAQRVEKNSGSMLSTEFLDFYPCLNIQSIENDSSFKEGNFDFLCLKSEDADLVLSFINLCKSYLNDKTMEFNDFIEGMIELFQLPKRESKLNAVGLFGELAVIKRIYESKEVDLTKGWHLSGAYSRYDFSFDGFNVEVKTTTSDTTNYLIKHSQLFGKTNNYICLVRIEKVENGGQSLKELINEMQNAEPYSRNVKFQISLKKELNKTFDPDVLRERYELKDIYFFLNKRLDTIKGIPSCITEIEYRYDFDISDAEDENEFIKENFNK